MNILLRLGRPAKLGLNDGGRATCLAGVSCALPPGANTPYWSFWTRLFSELVSLTTPAHYTRHHTPPLSYKSVRSIFTSSPRGSLDFPTKENEFWIFQGGCEVIRGCSDSIAVRLCSVLPIYFHTCHFQNNFRYKSYAVQLNYFQNTYTYI